MAIVRLPANLVAHCDAIADAFTNQARKVDSRTWTQMQSDASIHDYMAHKLKEGLAFWRSPGQAAWAWRATVSLRKGFIFTDGTSQTTSCTPYSTPQIGDRWWPCIFGDPTSNGLVPYYCPALAWQNGRPWFAHGSRLFEAWAPPFVFEAQAPPHPFAATTASQSATAPADDLYAAVHTTTVVIEEVPSSASSPRSSSSEMSWNCEDETPGSSSSSSTSSSRMSYTNRWTKLRRRR